jgi:hypothetical protein
MIPNPQDTYPKSAPVAVHGAVLEIYFGDILKKHQKQTKDL